MSEPRDETGNTADGVDGTAPLDFDPYRFGAPEHPVPPEYAPPGYVPPTPPPVPPSEPGQPYGSQPYGSQPYGSPPYGAPQYPPPPPGAAPYGSPQPGTPEYGAPQNGAPQNGAPQNGPYGGYPPVPPQFQSAYPAPQAGNGRAVAALVLGIVSILLCWTTLIDIVPVVLSLVFGTLARRQSARDPRLGGRGMATAGIICGVVGAVLAIALTVVVTRAVTHCNQYDSGTTQFNNCVEHYLHVK
ncbi:DUF4190 domain-containing protein [Jatrophihabitans sp.]|uniref:DUF4190 domain-containing protein n=1 Tax=Jatrophihabitans sp. TaxID=1932789 RepID=UPI0030C77C7C|nr:hypothetical protein [Jatrophihabitans sp.]